MTGRIRRRSGQRGRGRTAPAILAFVFLLGIVTGFCTRSEARIGAELPRETADDEARGAPLRLQAVPDINGPGFVTTAGNLWMKTTNIGFMGNPFPALSADPGAQWPGPSGIEYLYNWSLWVGARNPDRRASQRPRLVTAGIEWRPPSLAPEDRIYRSFEGAPGGVREVDDDSDGRIDEEWLDGRDDDGDGATDEDFQSIGQTMDAFVMRDDSPQSIAASEPESHVPLGLVVRQRTLAFSESDADDFNGVEYLVTNASGTALDSVYVGFLVDQDIGPVTRGAYWFDDVPEPRVPQADLRLPMDPEDPRYDPTTDSDHPAGFCVTDAVRVRGFTVADDDGDDGDTPGASAFLLLDHTVDIRGRGAPSAVGFRSYHLIRAVAPAGLGGIPVLDQDRYELLSSGAGVDPGSGRIVTDAPSESEGEDFATLCSIGPFDRVEPGDTIRVVVGLVVARIDYAAARDTPGGSANPARYEDLSKAALDAQLRYRGRYETPPAGTPVPPERGWETGLRAPPGTVYFESDCHIDSTAMGGREINDSGYSWFDFDCDACTGPPGMLPRRWVVGGPPPNPGLRLTPRDRGILVEWDNRSETVADRLTGYRDSTAYVRGKFNAWAYQVWRATDYTRPVGSIGPTDDLWELVAELVVHDPIRPMYDSTDTDEDGKFDAIRRTAPLLYDRERKLRHTPRDIPPLTDPTTSDTLFVTAERSVLDPQRGLVTDPAYRVPVYPVGRYSYLDDGLLNGFLYFYCVVAVDSTGFPGPDGTPGTVRKREGRRSSVESSAISPQSRVASAGSDEVYVVPNPYRGGASWDLTPSASDPTGTHVDFFNLPSGPWIIRIFTLAGDLVQTIRHDDATTGGPPQRQGPEDGQASWNLLSRNGQDVVSGIYLFSVESDLGTRRGKFVLIR